MYIKIKNKKIDLYLSLLFIILISVMISNYNILKLDEQLPIGDALNPYIISRAYYNSLKQDNIIEIINTFHSHSNSSDPPLISLIVLPFYILDGDVNLDIAAFSNIIYLFIMTYSTYFLGKKLINKHVGLFSSIFLIFNQYILSFSRVFLPTISVVSFVILTLTPETEEPLLSEI